MNLYELFERAERYSVVEVGFGDRSAVQTICDLINEGGQLSWTLTPSRLQDKIGDTGKLFGLYASNGDAVGVIGIKKTIINGFSGGEIGYLYVMAEHRSLQNAVQLYNVAVSNAATYDFVMATTNVNNSTVNTLLSRVAHMKLAFTAKSRFSSNMLNYWVCTVNNGKLDYEETVDLLRAFAGVDENVDESYISETTLLKEDIAFVNTEKAPSSFRSQLSRLVSRIPNVKIGEHSSDDIVFSFGRTGTLPTKRNTVYVGNVFYPKDKQMERLKNVVPTIATFKRAADIDGEFIAKRKTGHKQMGQLVNVEPDDADDYVFQPLLDIKSEYRVVTFYMNGEYHVSGVYKKSGSNAAFQSITGGKIYETASELAVKACERLGYGLSGVDIALVENNEHIISEALGVTVGKGVSAIGKLMGKFASSAIAENEVLVVLECNTMPSMSNPMILVDLISKVKSVANSVSLSESATLQVDVPNEEWLEDNINYAKSKPRRHGVPFMGKITAYYRSDLGRYVLLPVALLSKIPGENQEQENVRHDDLEWLKKELSENGLKNTGVPYIEVAYDGSAWVNEGNHRIMAAKELGWKYMPVEIRYFDGGERIEDGVLHPDKVLRLHSSGNPTITEEEDLMSGDLVGKIVHIDSHSGQNDFELQAYDRVSDAIVGTLEFTEYNGDVHINMIHVDENHRGHGVGKFMVTELQKEYPETELQWGLTTEDGQRLRQSLETVTVPSEYAEKFKRLQELITVRDKIENIFNDFDKMENPSDKIKQQMFDLGNRMNDIHDEIYDLENELFDKKPTKTLISTM